MTKFEEDIGTLMTRLRVRTSGSTTLKLDRLAERLTELKEQNMLKINHSVIEMVIAKHLIERGYEVKLEEEVDGSLTCDVHATKGLGVTIVEVETGYVPPSHALDPVDYIRARISSKIARYSSYCHKFILASPPHYIMPIPEVLIKPPRSRREVEVSKVKEYCDLYYSNPPVSKEEIINSRVHSVFIVDVDRMSIKENDPVDYFKKSLDWFP